MELFQRQVIGFLSCALIILGIFAPVVSLPVIGSLSYFRIGQSDCVILLILVAVSGILIFSKRLQGLWLTGTASIAIILFTLVDLTAHIEATRVAFERDMQGGPLVGLGIFAGESVQLQWGWGLLFVGALAILVAAAWEDTDSGRRLARRKILVVSILLAICWVVFYVTANLNNPVPAGVQRAIQP